MTVGQTNAFFDDISHCIETLSLKYAEEYDAQLLSYCLLRDGEKNLNFRLGRILDSLSKKLQRDLVTRLATRYFPPFSTGS